MENNKETIISLFNQGKIYEEIAEEIGCSKSSVYGALLRWGVIDKNFNTPEYNKEKILDLKEKKKTQQEIAKEIGCSRSAIAMSLKRWDVK